MNANNQIKLSEPRIIDAKAMHFAGLGRHFRYDAMDAIPSLWQEFAPYIGNLPGELPGATYGVCANSSEDGLDYFAAVAVAGNADLPAGLKTIDVPPARFAVFAHKGHLSEIRNVFGAVLGEWLPRSGYQLADGPSLERYGESFDPATGRGGYEVWVPLRA